MAGEKSTSGKHPRARQGPPTPIRIHVERNRGRKDKYLTHVSFLDQWGIDAYDICAEGQRAFAAATTASSQGSVIVQGNVGGTVSKWLEKKFSIPSKYIDVVRLKGKKNKTKKNKKKS